MRRNIDDDRRLAKPAIFATLEEFAAAALGGGAVADAADRFMNSVVLRNGTVPCCPDNRSARHQTAWAPVPMESGLMPFRPNGSAGVTDEMSGNGSPLVLLSPDDVAKYLAKPKSWIYGNWRSQGIPFKKVGNALRCRQGDLNDWLDRQNP